MNRYVCVLMNAEVIKMTIIKKMEDALNKQINAELYSAYLYMSMSANFESMNLKGCANWMRIQAQEEMTHSDKFYKYLIDRGGNVILDSIGKPPAKWKTPLMAFTQAYKHEQKITGMINNLVNIAKELKDHASESMLQWFVDEQVEEEASADEIVEKLKLMQDAPGGLYMMDQELAKRVFIPPQGDNNG